jgi:uncharacterized peroxidase-related enzyme
MSRIPIPSRDEAPTQTQPILGAAEKLLGFVPNLHRLMSLSPAVLTGWAALQSALSKTLDVKTRDGIALAVSEVDGCTYCLAAHSYVAEKFGKMSPEEIALNRQGRSSDPKRDAVLHFARKLVETRGKVAATDLVAVRQAGYGNPEILEIVALAAQFLLTNFMNNVAETESDFPMIEPGWVA